MSNLEERKKKAIETAIKKFQEKKEKGELSERDKEALTRNRKYPL